MYKDINYDTHICIYIDNIYIYYMIQIYAMEYIKKNDRDLYVPKIRQDQ